MHLIQVLATGLAASLPSPIAPPHAVEELSVVDPAIGQSSARNDIGLATMLLAGFAADAIIAAAGV